MSLSYSQRGLPANGRFSTGNLSSSYGDRIPLSSFYKHHMHSSRRKQGLFEKLREKLKLKKENHSWEEVPETSNKTRSRAKQSTRNIEKGWVHTGDNVTKQVRAKQGEGDKEGHN